MYKNGITIWYDVSDLEKTKLFYRDYLGFEILLDLPQDNMVITKTNTLGCEIGFSEADSVKPSTSALVFEVENIKLAIETLKSKGVVFKDDYREIPEMVKLISFNDPDGHLLMLAESLNN
jgi:catechol 2,3-dioxygenase-like lactoylglutathione lyase family enzyme